MNLRTRIRAAGVLAVTLLVAACTGSGSTTTPIGSPPVDSPRGLTPSPTAASAPESTAAASAALDGLVLLADSGGVGLWTEARGSGWSRAADASAATAIGGTAEGLLLAGGSTVEVRTLASLSQPLRSTVLQWRPGTIPTIESVSASAAGELALAVSDGDRTGFATATASGAVSAVDIPDAQPFSPLVAWIDGSRRVVLTTDARQVSRLAVSAKPGEYQPLAAIEGCRWFAVSADGKTIAVATDDAVFAGSTAAVLAGTAPGAISQVAAGAVVWDLALDASGTRLAFLTGTVGADGTVSAPTEVVYQRAAAAWAQSAEVDAPAARIIGQAWAG